MIVEVAGQRFKSKAALLTRIREVLYAYNLGDFVSPEDFAFLNQCLNQANEFYGYPVERPTKWRVQVHPTWKNREFVFHREDGTRENPSIKRLSMTKPRGPKTAKAGARQDISCQVLAFRDGDIQNNRYQCSECPHSSSSSSEFEVHHVIPFSELWDYFVSHMKLIESDLSVAEQHDEDGAMISFGLSYPINIAWKGFHKNHAKLQLLCIKCHAFKTYADKSE